MSPDAVSLGGVILPAAPSEAPGRVQSGPGKPDSTPWPLKPPRYSENQVKRHPRPWPLWGSVPVGDTPEKEAQEQMFTASRAVCGQDARRNGEEPFSSGR